ncbi:MAG: UvrD-helicase domain-containing protein [Burkholderiaceae bacterium]|jgi:DNA helicase-2/ATP-dependent DNA helicase PcrA
MPDLLDQLNPEQRAAVTLPPQSALILAGAGSGKTRVLTTRIAWLIQTQQVSPAGVLAVTFTNKAAREMQLRLSAMLPINIRGMWIGTFHGICNRFLRAHYRDAGLPQSFQILDSADQLALIKRLLKGMGLDDERYPARQIAWFINNAKEDGLRAKDVEVEDDFNRKFVELFEIYDAQCQREGVVDFAELMLRTYELLKRNEPLREHYQARFRHILIDEFQDTNILQYKWVKLLAGYGTAHPSAVFAVGDDDQSIYAFRGANVANMAQFEREFKVQNLIKLEQNYRSHGYILDSANALIRHNQERLGKNLWTSEGLGELVRVYESATDVQEAQWVIEEIKSLVSEGHARSDIAILYRSNAQSRVIEHGLFNAGIPYRVYGGLRFFERQEVKHALAYLRLIGNPHDDGALLRVINVPARGIGARTLEQLQEIARARGGSLRAAAPFLSGKAQASVGSFLQMIEAMRLATEHMTLSETIAHLNDASGLIAYYENEKDGRDRVENLNELVNAAASFAGEQGLPLDQRARDPVLNGRDIVSTESTDGAVTLAGISPLDAFVSHASLEAGENQAGEGQDALQLMTVHSAKGLEFDAVFITGLEEGLFPHENSTSEKDGTEEERRLMYVAITRARERLYLSFSQTRLLHGQTRYNMKSRFFNELPPTALKWLTPPRAPAYGYGSARGRYGDAGTAWAEDVLAPVTHPPAWSQARRAESTGFRIGQSVTHAKFGEGVIVNLEGNGSDARAQINFGKAGMKWLALGIAKLTPA